MPNYPYAQSDTCGAYDDLPAQKEGCRFLKRHNLQRVQSQQDEQRHGKDSRAEKGDVDKSLEEMNSVLPRQTLFLIVAQVIISYDF